MAVHRFGLGEPSLEPVGRDALGWLLSQIGPADTQRGDASTGSTQALRLYAALVPGQNQARRASPGAAAPMAGVAEAAEAGPAPGGRSGDAVLVTRLRDTQATDVRARLVTAATTARPFAERMALFWANHFTVSMAKASARGIVGAFEREAVRPHVAGRFETLLQVAVTHPGMLRYLDNDLSAGPDSLLVQRLARRARGGERTPRVSGLNENLAREVLELHTLGAGAGCTQVDMTEFAAVLTGWRVALADPEPATRFDPAWHQGGPQSILGRLYPDGAEALTLVLRDLAAHPATAHHICTKLARHLVADVPPAAQVAVDGTLGTDHGSGGDAFVLGGAVRGGRVLADWPGLAKAQRFEGRDLRITTPTCAPCSAPCWPSTCACRAPRSTPRCYRARPACRRCRC